MLVVADSSPLIVLVQIGHIEVLPKLFGQIVIPPAVAAELRSSHRSERVREYFAIGPAWLGIRQPVSVLPIPELHVGEAEALSLAVELHADVLLVDERRAYREAVARHLNAIGTIRVLERAAEEKLLDLKDAFDRVKASDFWISQDLLDERLRIHLSSGRP
jgi:predicted nucleic acid-binding protein